MTNNDMKIIKDAIANGEEVIAEVLPWTPPAICDCADDDSCIH